MGNELNAVAIGAEWIQLNLCTCRNVSNVKLHAHSITEAYHQYGCN